MRLAVAALRASRCPAPSLTSAAAAPACCISAPAAACVPRLAALAWQLPPPPASLATFTLPSAAARAPAEGAAAQPLHLATSSDGVPKGRVPSQPGDGLAFLDSLINHETRGVPEGAGVATSDTAFDLTSMRSLLLALGNPQEQLRAVHVAGTKGKGSVVAMVSAVLRAAGQRVGTYSSPHVLHLGERIQGPQGLGSPLPLAQLDALALRLRDALLGRQAAQGQPQAAAGGAAAAAALPSHFEALTALALRHFADEGADVAVVEAGLGGATDATNVFPAQQLQAAIITPIGLDHVAALGGSLESIAAAKAGIMRPDRPVVIALQPQPAALQVLEAAAERLGSRVVRAEHVVQVSAGPVSITPGAASAVQCAQQEVSVTAAPAGAAGRTAGSVVQLSGVHMGLVGTHQHSNVQAAVAAVLLLRQQGWSIPDAAIKQGLQQAWLPGRFQVIPFPVADTPGAAPPYLVLDGAHTADSAAALAAELRAAFPARPLVLVLAMAADKEHAGVVAALRALAPRVVVFTSVAVAGGRTRSAPPGTLAAHWQAAPPSSSGGRRVRCRELIQAGMTAALQRARQELASFGEPGVVCVTGSLHAVGAALRELQRQQET